ncbi:MAG: PorT family protein [Bacteroidales bacterium]|jgi:hypothetical protein|nr:PorT family protein [Bacteroidales bacterium]
MKKNQNRLINKTFTFLSLLIAMSSLKVNAQVSVSGGLKMEANIHQFWLYDTDAASKIKMAPNLGGFVNIELNDRSAIQPEMMFFFRNSRIRQGNLKDDFRQWGMTLSAYWISREHIDNGTWYFGLGGYADLGFNARLKHTGTALYRKTEGQAAIMNRWDYGIRAMLGYEYSNGLQINVGLQLGLKDQLDAGRDEATAINKVITVGIGYHF